MIWLLLASASAYGGDLANLHGWGDLTWDAQVPAAGSASDTYGCVGQAGYHTKTLPCPNAPRDLWGVPIKSAALRITNGKLLSVNLTFNNQDPCRVLRQRLGQPSESSGNTEVQILKWLEGPLSAEAVCSSVIPSVTLSYLGELPAETFTPGEQHTAVGSFLTMLGHSDGLAYNYRLHDGGTIYAWVGARPGVEPIKLTTELDWRITCKVDPMDDSKTCSIARSADDVPVALLVAYSNDMAPSICVGSDNYPGKPVQLRVDANPAHTQASGECFTGDEAKAIVEEIRKGTQVVTRYQEWPYEAWKTSTLNTTGFDLALNLTGWLHARR